MARSSDPRKPTPFQRGPRRYHDVGGHVPPGDEVENTRDHERIWFELRHKRSCCDCDSPGFKYCFQTFDYPSYICDGEFPGGDTLAGFWPGVRKNIGLSDGVTAGCLGADLVNLNFSSLIPHENGSWRNGPFVTGNGSNLDLVTGIGWNWSNRFPATAWTFEFWLKPSQADIDSGVRLIAHGISGDALSQGGMDVNLRTGGGISLRQIQVAGGAIQESGAGWFEADQWHHVAIVRNTVAKTVAIFVNGRIAISRVIPTTGWAVSTFPATPTFMFAEHGSWADIAAYNSALSPTIIRRHYQAVYGVEGAANPLSSVEGDPTQVEDPTQVITEQISVDLIDGGGDVLAGYVAISQGDYTAWVSPEDSPFELEARKSQPDGYASLDANGYVPSEELASASTSGLGFLREDDRWIDGRVAPIPDDRELRLLSWYEEPEEYVAALPSIFTRIWLLDGDSVPFADSGTFGQPFTSGTFTVDQFGAFGRISCPVFAGGTDGLQTAAVAASSSQFAFALWVRVDALPAAPVNLIKATDNVFGLRLNPDGTVESWAGANIVTTSVATVTVGEWCHIYCENDAVGLTKVSRIGVNGVLNSGTTRFGSGNGNGYTLAGDGFEGAMSVVAASSGETDGNPNNAVVLSLATDYRKFSWSAYTQSGAGVTGGIDASENDTPVTAAPRSRVNVKGGTNVTVDVVDDPTGDEIEVTISATSPAGAGIEVSEAGADVTASPRGRLDFVAAGDATVDVADDAANDKAVVTVGVTLPAPELPDATGASEGDVLTLDASLAKVWAAPPAGGGGAGTGQLPLDAQDGDLLRAAGDPYYYDVVLADSPLAYWPLQDVAGSSIVEDVVGTNDLTVSGTVTLESPAGPVTDKDKYAALAAAAKLSHAVFSADETFSFEMWFRFAALPGSNADFWGNGDVGGGGKGWQAWLTPAGKISGVWQNVAFWGNSVTTFAVDTWYHLAFVRDAANAFKLYVNGALDTTLSASNPGDNPVTNFYIGKTLACDAAHAAYYVEPLTPTQIAAHFDARDAAGIVWEAVTLAEVLGASGGAVGDVLKLDAGLNPVWVAP